MNTGQKKERNIKNKCVYSDVEYMYNMYVWLLLVYIYIYMFIYKSTKRAFYFKGGGEFLIILGKKQGYVCMMRRERG